MISDIECHYRLEDQVEPIAKPGIWQDRGQCRGIIPTPYTDMKPYSSPGPQGHIATLPRRPKHHIVGVVGMRGNKKNPILALNIF